MFSYIYESINKQHYVRPSDKQYNRPTDKNVEIIMNALQKCSQTECKNMLVELNTEHMKNDINSRTSVNIFMCTEFYNALGFALEKVTFKPHEIMYPYNNRMFLNKKEDGTIDIRFND